jgi:hypothetical protein
MPLNAAGFIWAGLGFVLFGGLVSMLRQLIGVVRRRSQARSLLGRPQAQ